MRPIGSKRQRCGSWEVRVTRGGVTLSGTVADEGAADALMLSFAAQLGRDVSRAPSPTLSAWWQAWRDGRGQRLARVTLRRYEGSMRRCVLPALGHLRLRDVSRADVQRMLLACPTRGEAERARRALSSVLSEAERAGLVAANVARGRYDMPPEPLPEPTDGGDPFAAIEGAGRVWPPQVVLAAMPLLRGHPVEGCWLCMVGAGLRREEALALTWRDVRRVEVGGRMVVQLAVWRARTWEDGTRATKTARSRRVAAVAEPFASRLWELRGDPDALVCPLGAGNMARTWRRLWGDGRPLASLPYLPLSRMRATHETMMQAAGVPDSVNAAAHGHSVAVAYGHYMRPDSASAAGDVGDMLAGSRGQGGGVNRTKTGHRKR